MKYKINKPRNQKHTIIQFIVYWSDMDLSSHFPDTDAEHGLPLSESDLHIALLSRLHLAQLIRWLHRDTFAMISANGIVTFTCIIMHFICVYSWYLYNDFIIYLQNSVENKIFTLGQCFFYSGLMKIEKGGLDVTSFVVFCNFIIIFNYTFDVTYI